MYLFVSYICRCNLPTASNRSTRIFLVILSRDFGTKAWVKIYSNWGLFFIDKWFNSDFPVSQFFKKEWIRRGEE